MFDESDKRKVMETQNVEYKVSWRDEYIKWICGFANAQGGILYIGVDDDGTVVGLNDVHKLLEDIPNKVRDKLGIVVRVNMIEKDGKPYIEIVTSPSSFPINYNGEYHYRSGATKQLLQGVALTQFLMEKTGVTWDSVLMDDLSIDDFRDDDFLLFKQQALKSGRLDEDDMKLTKSQLLEKLGLLKNGKVMRAAMMVFHPAPETWINGAYVKIGFFESDDDLRYWDEVHGPLLVQAERTIDLIYTKYLKAEISYEGVTRVEKYPFPKAAIREAVYNAIVHKNYARQIPIQISVYPNMIYIGNDCVFPMDWTTETLLQKHRSNPYNPNIANVFFRAGFIEAWGRGIEKMCNECKRNHVELPEYTLHSDEIMVRFMADSAHSKQDLHNDLHNNCTIIAQRLPEGAPTVVFKAFEVIAENPSATRKQLSSKLKVSERTVAECIAILKRYGCIVRVGGNKSGYWKILKIE